MFSYSIKHRLEALERGSNLVYTDMICYHTTLNREFQKDGNYFRNKYKGFLHHTLMWDFETFVALDEYCRKTYATPGIFDPSLTALEDRDVSISTFEFVDMLNLNHEYLPINTYGYTSQSDSITGNLTRKTFNKYKLQVFQKHSINYGSYLFDNIGDITLEYYWKTKYLLPNQIKNRLTLIERFAKKIF